MPSVLGIWNRALQLLGATRVTDISENSPNARSCAAVYEARRDALLRAYNWTFAIKRAQLAADTERPAFQFDYQYTWPANALRILPPVAGPLTGYRDWVMEGRKILTCDSGPLDVRYIDRIEDASLMDPLFREALAADMAENMADDITQSNTKRQLAKDAKRDAVNEARRVGSIEKGAQQAAEDDWVSVRRM